MNRYDLTAAQIVPVNVEKIPLYHWRPGSRLLQVGSRDGAAFDDDLDRAEKNTYRRPLDAAVIDEAAAKSKVDGLCAAWSAPLRYHEGMSLLSSRRRPLVVCTPPFGDEALLRELMPRVDAWLLLLSASDGPLAEKILSGGRHVEVLLGLNSEALPPTAIAKAKAIHLTTLHTGTAAEADRQRWFAQARADLPKSVPVYDDQSQHSDCFHCGARLVWRSGGRSRLENLDPATGSCRGCGSPSGFTL